MNEFIILFRETLEAALIVGIIYLFLTSNNASTQKLWLAVLTAIIASVIVAYFIYTAQEALGNTSLKALFEGIFMFITAAFIWYVIFWLSKHVSDRKQLEESSAIAMSSSWGIFFLVFFSIIREGFETVVFLLASFSMTKSFSYIGFFGGMIAALFLVYLLVIQGRRFNIREFFKYTTLLLVFLASGMIAYGTHEVESYLVKSDNLQIVGLENKKDIPRPWNILIPKDELSDSDNSILYSYDLRGKGKFTHVMHDSGSIGAFLKGFFGYNSNPNYVELYAWIVSLIIGLFFWRRFYFSQK
jgi:high-affinity iron transporter